MKTKLFDFAEPSVVRVYYSSNQARYYMRTRPSDVVKKVWRSGVSKYDLTNPVHLKHFIQSASGTVAENKSNISSSLPKLFEWAVK